MSAHFPKSTRKIIASERRKQFHKFRTKTRVQRLTLRHAALLWQVSFQQSKSGHHNDKSRLRIVLQSKNWPFEPAVEVGEIVIHPNTPRSNISILFRYPNSAFVLRLLDDLLGNLAGDRIVMRELHVETAARSSDRIQRRLIVEHFGHGHLRFDYLLLAACVHALHPSATR